MNIRTGTVQNMGALTEKVFRGDGESLAVIKTYKESIGVFAKAISARLKYGGMPVEYESIADFGSFSGEFLEKVLDELDLEGVYFKRK